MVFDTFCKTKCPLKLVGDDITKCAYRYETNDETGNIAWVCNYQANNLTPVNRKERNRLRKN